MTAKKGADGSKTRKKRVHRRPVGRLTIANVTAALRVSVGIQSRAAEKLGVAKSTICTFIQAHPELKGVIEEIADNVLDLATGNVLDMLTSAEPSLKFQVSKYVLDNLGQGRGFGVRKMAFSDGEGNVMAPGVLVGPMELVDPDEWERRHQPKP